MTVDYPKLAAEQIREKLGWELKYYETMGCWMKNWYPGHPMSSLMSVSALEQQTWDSLIRERATTLEQAARIETLNVKIEKLERALEVANEWLRLERK